MPLSATRTTPRGIRSTSSSEVSSRTSKRLQVAIVHADRIRARLAQCIQHALQLRCRMHLNQHIEPTCACAAAASRFISASVSAAAISRIASARCARVSTTWYSSTMKSLRRHGRGIVCRRNFEVSQAALKERLIGQNGKSRRPAEVIAPASHATSKSSRISPFDGEAFLISAITAGPSPACRRNAAAHPRGT